MVPIPPDTSSREDFIQLFLEAEVRLRAFICSVLVVPDEREDVLQEVALLLWREFARFDPARAFLPWACGIAARVMRQRHRTGARRARILSEAAVDVMQRLWAEPDPVRDEREAALAECLAGLPEGSARIIRERYWQGRSIESLASSTGQSPDALYQLLSRLRRRLADCVRQRLAAPEKSPSATAIRP